MPTAEADRFRVAERAAPRFEEEVFILRRLRRPRLSYANVTATLALFVALGGTALATTQTFVLGTTDRVDAATTVTNVKADNSQNAINNPLVTLTNLTTSSSATALRVNVASGHAPFTVNSSVRVLNLNADKLDNLDSSAFAKTTQLGARAYASVASDTTLVGAKNITQVSNPDPGFYCLTLGGGIDASTATAVATPNFSNDATQWTINGPQSIVEVSGLHSVCPSGDR